MLTIKNNVYGNILSSDVVLVVQEENIAPKMRANVNISSDDKNITVEFAGRLRKPSVIPVAGHTITVSLSPLARVLGGIALLVAAPIILYAAYMMLTRQATPLVAIGGFGVLALIEAANLILVRTNRDLKFSWE